MFRAVVTIAYDTNEKQIMKWVDLNIIQSTLGPPRCPKCEQENEKTFILFQAHCFTQ